MEMNERSNFDLDKNGYHHHHLNFHGSGLLLEAGAPVTISQGSQMAYSPSPLVAMSNSFSTSVWNPPPQNLALCEITAGTPIAGHPFVSPGILRPGLSHFLADSGFIERAARFSCFNGSNLGGLMNHPFVNSESLRPFPNAASRKNDMNLAEGCKDASLVNDHGSSSRSPREQRDVETSHGVGASNNESGEPESSGGGGGQEEGPNVLGAKKRKRLGEDNEMNQAEGNQQLPPKTTKENNDNDERGEPKRPVTASGKSNGKQAKDSTDTQKEEYIHVRARRGQATNSHSLAERVRREKISERMKFLQDLVPGCSKVTGKAVMLDEIINYVQSLQRQVEFLSMKLAAVNPGLDFNIEGILSKDLFHSEGVSSSAIGFLPDIVHPQLHPSQLVQAGVPGMMNPTDALRRVIDAQATSNSGYKEPTHQMPNAWVGEFHNVMPMPYTPLNAQELNSKPRDGFTH